jgi:hypothetical protein
VADSVEGQPPARLAGGRFVWGCFGVKPKQLAVSNCPDRCFGPKGPDNTETPVSIRNRNSPKQSETVPKATRKGERIDH